MDILKGLLQLVVRVSHHHRSTIISLPQNRSQILVLPRVRDPLDCPPTKPNLCLVYKQQYNHLRVEIVPQVEHRVIALLSHNYFHDFLPLCLAKQHIRDYIKGSLWGSGMCVLQPTHNF